MFCYKIIVPFLPGIFNGFYSKHLIEWYISFLNSSLSRASAIIQAHKNNCGSLLNLYSFACILSLRITFLLKNSLQKQKQLQLTRYITLVTNHTSQVENINYALLIYKKNTSQAYTAITSRNAARYQASAVVKCRLRQLLRCFWLRKARASMEIDMASALCSAPAATGASMETYKRAFCKRGVKKKDRGIYPCL